MPTMNDTPEEKIRADFERWWSAQRKDVTNPITPRMAWNACAAQSAAELSRLKSELAAKDARLREFEESAKIELAPSCKHGCVEWERLGDTEPVPVRIPKGGE